MHTCILRAWGASANFGHAKDGKPVYYERTGLIAAKGLMGMVADAGDEGPVDRHIWQQELMMARMEEMSTILGRRVDKQVVVFDMAGLSYWPNPVGLRAFKKVLHIDSTFYPETLGTHFIINAPVIFTAIWAFVKPWLDPVTADKVQIIFSKSSARTALLKVIDASQLPTEYGGTSSFVVEPVRCSRAKGLTFAKALHGEQG